MNRKILIVILLVFCLVPVIPLGEPVLYSEDLRPVNEFQESAITATQIYNVSDYSIVYGSNTTDVLPSAMNVSDNTNASFIEERIDGVADSLFGDTSTDSAANWESYYRFDNLGTTTDAYTGSTAVRAQFTANSGEPIIRFDNNTGYAMALDKSDMDHFNFSIKASSAGPVLHTVEMHNSETTYGYVTYDTPLTTSYQVLEHQRGDPIKVGGMTPASPLNWISFSFTNPINNEWIYIDNIMFYNSTTERRLQLSLNFTSVAYFQHYDLNVSAASNVTLEDMRVGGTFFHDDGVNYDIDTQTWDNFTIELNETKIQSLGYAVFSIKSTALIDDYNSTLDIDLFTITAYNETNNQPDIDVSASCTNLDDTNRMYAGYKNYTITFNVSDADGFADIHYAEIGFATDNREMLGKFGFFEDNETFVDLAEDNATLWATNCVNVSAGNDLDLTFSIELERNITSFADVQYYMFVNDTEGASESYYNGTTFQTEVNLEINDLSISDSRGDIGATVYITGNVYYFESATNITADVDTYDVWVGNDYDSTKYSATTWNSTGFFNISIVTPSEVVLTTYRIGAREEGLSDPTGYECYCGIGAQTKTYISDYIIVTLSTGTLDATNGVNIVTKIVAEYAYDATEVTGFTATMAWDGSQISGSYTYSSNQVSLRKYDTSGDLTIYSITDSTYGLTEFSANTLTLSWSGGSSGDDSGDDSSGTPIGSGDFVSTNVNWAIVGIVVSCFGYLGIFGVGSFQGIGGPTARRLRDDFIKSIKGMLRLPGGSYRPGRRTDSLSSRLPSGSDFGKYRIKLPKKWGFKTKSRRRKR